MGDVVYRMTADEGRAVAAFLKVVDVQKKVEDGAKRGAHHTKKHGQAMQRLGQRAMQDLKGMVAGWIGVQGAIRLARGGWRLFQQDIEKGKTAIKEFSDEFINLLFLGDRYKDPKARAKVRKLAGASGIPAPELAKGMYALESMTAWATPEQRAKMGASLINQRKIGNVPIGELVPTQAKLGGMYRNLTGKEMGSISQHLIDKAAVHAPADVAAQGPKVWEAGKLGDVDARTAAATYSVLTAKTGTPALGAQAMKMLYRKVMLVAGDAEELLREGFGKGGGLEGRKTLLTEAGVVETDTAHQRIMKLSRRNRRKKYKVDELKTLVGERAAGYAKNLFADPEGLQAMVDDFQVKTRKGVDLIGTKRKGGYATDQITRLAHEVARTEEEVKTKRASEANTSLAWEVIRNKAIARETGDIDRWMAGGIASFKEFLHAKLPSLYKGPAGVYAQEFGGTEAEARKQIGLDPGKKQPDLEPLLRSIFEPVAEKLDAAAENLKGATAPDPNAKGEPPAAPDQGY